MDKRTIAKSEIRGTRYGELGARLRKEGLYSSHVVTWRQPREAGLTPKKRGRKMTAVDPQRKKLEQENRRLTSRLQKAEALLAFQKSFRTPTDPPEPVRERRGRLMVAVDDATPTLGAASACRVLGLPRASLYRGRRPVAVARPRPAPPRALDPIERQGILDLLHTRFIDQAPAQIHATLLDEGTYLCSPRTMYRVLDAAHEVKERRAQVRRPPYAAPELLATRPNEVWSWDITKLLGPSKWTYFYLYVILDIFSRYVVGWMLAPHERAALAEHLIGETCAKHGIQPGQLTLHADRGSSMKSKPVALLLADLGVTKTPAARTCRTTIRSRKRSLRRSSTVRSFQSASGRSRTDGRVGRSSFPGTTRNTATAAWGSSRPPSCISARPPRAARSASRCSPPHTRRIPSASSRADHNRPIYLARCGSTHPRRTRPRRMPQEQRSSSWTTSGSTRVATPTTMSPS